MLRAWQPGIGESIEAGVARLDSSPTWATSFARHASKAA
jgi:hypothetical protein